MRRPGALIAAWALAATPVLAAGPRHSGFDDMTPQLQAMQRDDAANPAMLWVNEGASMWEHDCSRCHGDAAKSMRGVATRYPAFDAATQRPITLAQRINQCRVARMQTTPLAPESDALLSIESYVAFQSRGRPIAPPADPRLRAARERGEQLFHRRIGQLDFSCAQCHDDHAGQRLGGSTIPQAHPTGYPMYRLEWQGMASLQRRLRSCMAGVRAEPFAYDAPELTELELYLATRAAGLPLETPAVRP
ncbi:MAG TPA: sulfur oxidation c-type cytochrome SoxA [Burkholderiaceae bacterium]|jgi:sulfur-oxidizing protein SoxA